MIDTCMFCHKVKDRLDELDIDYNKVIVPTNHSERDVVKRVSGQRVVPVLVDDEHGVTMPESENILDYIDKTIVPSLDATPNP